ncbi:hypothetical protein U9M48_021078 [Paspalum notatum var. saurae]|uniref:SANT domain-containing protein n=1 Tax=Paspalum notatum var. saurae TaxID=547442 RepID=A0AAQ3WT87_PASNO
MAPAKGSRSINKTVIKGYEEHQQHDDLPSSSKARQKKRKISDLDPEWSKDELTHFYKAYRRHGKDWKKISLAVGGKSSDMVRSLYSVHRTFLSLPECQATAIGFIALVTGHRNDTDKYTSHIGDDHMVRPSRNTRKRGEIAQQKANEGPGLQNCHEGIISGFSPSFKKRYYGELVRNCRNDAVRRRTPRIPIIAPTDRNTIDAVPMDECSPDRITGIAEANKAGQNHTLSETKGTINTPICQQHLRKARIHQTMEEGQICKVEHETVMASKEGNSLNDNQIPSDIISEDDMLVLDVLNSLVKATSKTSKLEINLPSGSIGKTDYPLSHRREEGPSTIDKSKHGKPVGKSSASKIRKKRHKKHLAAGVPPEAQNISLDNLVMPETQRVGITDDSSLCTDSGRVGIPEVPEEISTEVPNVPTETRPEIRMSRRARRKSQMHCKTQHMSCNEGSDNLQVKKLLHCLSSESLRKWCTYEWFYSAVDFPWFSNNEFVHYLDHAKLSHLNKLTRSEWSAIRSSLGKPRRFSDHFLAVEKEKLEDYRQKVRKIYGELSDGSRDSLPADLARPFSIGQQVIVRDPSSRELCDGKVVMMGPDCYKVQFVGSDLGVDIVKDTDCMPVNWLDNCPENMRRSYLSNNAHSLLDTEQIPDLTPSENWDHGLDGVSAPEHPNTLCLISHKQLKAESVENSERAPYMSMFDGPTKSRSHPENNAGHNIELESYITAFVQSSLSDARKMVEKAMQAKYEGSDDEKVCTPNQATERVGVCLEPEAAVRGGQLPSNLISNCIATVLSIKRLSDSRHPPANVAGVLEYVSTMLRPICSENFAIYKDIETYLAIIVNQILALVPTALGNCGPPFSPM